ncbi:MAG: hypothetical protein NZV14_09695 [Bryobacteraceae bacterium]|nr:hypothetical protein [Bryobacteraceae bacterium]MDW8378423.1 hypothetical protein [Bryobacterales bacterium]
MILPSGNHILWIRPRWDMVQSALDSWGDTKDAPDPATWFSLAYDRAQKFWIARQNWQEARRFLGAVTGSAEQGIGELRLYGAWGGEPVLILPNYQYDLVAQHCGNAFQGTRQGNRGAKIYLKRTRFVRQVDLSALTPFERLAEMVDHAVRDEKFGAQLRQEFGQLANPWVLLSLAAVLGVFLGIGAGAAMLGGAAFAAAVSRLLGIGMVALQVEAYHRLF